MSFLLKDSEKIFAGYFKDISENQFTFLATNCEGFFSEKLSCETLISRVEEMNESIRYKQSKVIKTLKEQVPESCTLTLSKNSLRIVLKFVVSNLPLKIFFDCSKCSESEIGQFFTTGLIKSAIESGLLITKMKKAIEAKDMEIEEYKRNGGILIRDSLATKKFNFTDEFQLSMVKLNESQITFDISPLVTQSNIPNLCKMIHAENVLNDSSAAIKLTDTQNRSSYSISKSRIPVAPKFVEKKFQYVGEDDEEPTDLPSGSRKTRSQSPVPDVPKKARIVKKPFIF